MIKRYVAITTAVLVCASLFAGGLLPIFADATTTTTTVTNEGANWLRMGYDEGLTKNFTINVELSGDTISVGSQTGEATDMILYSDDASSVCLVDGILYLITDSGASELPESFTIKRTMGVVSIDDEVISSGSIYTYYPDSSGNYAYFESDSAPIRYNGEYFSAMGTFASLTVTENYSPYGLEMDADLDGDYINSVIWALPGAEDLSLDTILPITIPGDNSTLPFNPPGEIDIDLEPIDIEDLGGDIIMTVPPTPSYTDGYWGYEYFGNYARIVSYSGPSNIDIVIPSIVNDRTVKVLGNTSTAIFDTSLSFGTLTIPSSITDIGTNAFSGCTGFTGPLTIPSSVTSIESNAFSGCTGFTGPLTIPSSVTSIGANAFSGCTGFTGPLTIPSSVTSIGINAFRGSSGLSGLVVLSNATPGGSSFLSTGIKEVLNLGTREYTTTSYGLNAEEVRSDIPGAGFLAPIEVTIKSTNPTPTTMVIGIAPVVIAGGLVLGVLTVMVFRRI